MQLEWTDLYLISLAFFLVSTTNPVILRFFSSGILGITSRPYAVARSPKGKSANYHNSHNCKWLKFW